MRIRFKSATFFKFSLYFIKTQKRNKKQLGCNLVPFLKITSWDPTQTHPKTMGSLLEDQILDIAEKLS